MRIYKPFECVEDNNGWLYIIYEVTPDNDILVKQVSPKVERHEPFLLEKKRIAEKDR